MSDVAMTRAQRLAEEPWEHAGARSSGFSGFVAASKDVWHYRELLGRLTKRELKARYKDSKLGFVWSLVRPLTMLFVYAVVVGEFLGAARQIENFGIYIFAGLAIYTVYQEIVGAGTSAIVVNSGLIKKVYLPREIFPLATIGPAMFTLAIQLAILIVAAAVTPGALSFGSNLLYAPAAIILAIIWSAAFALALSAINVYLRDIAYLVDVVLVLVMWGSPILYSIAMVEERLMGGAFEWLLPVYVNSPVTLTVLGFQEAFWQAGAATAHVPALWLNMLVSAGVGLLALYLAQRIFARLQGDFAQEL
ncbi:ABC transporter permease [Agrococcus sp. ProA11]|uniref:ABC transporter permease n=1 Tax=Agrococcus chionoecetis TaxID=3153752 RepID=UPI003260D618